MRFSIIIPAYNYARYLPRAIDSVLRQDGDDFELIIVDDGSTDDTRRLAAAYRDRLRYVYQDNRGPGAARNRGVDEAHGEHLIFLDADDGLLPDALARFRDYVAGHPDRDMVFGGYVSVSAAGGRKARPARKLAGENAGNFAAYVSGKFSIANGSAVMRRRIFSRLRYPESVRQNEDKVVEAQVLALFRCASFAEPVVEIHAHRGRLRDDVGALREAGDQVVDLIFDHGRLPSGLMRYRTVFLSRHLLNRSRGHYLSGDYRAAVALYHEAVRARPVNFFHYGYLRKYLRSLFRLILTNGGRPDPGPGARNSGRQAT